MKDVECRFRLSEFNSGKMIATEIFEWAGTKQQQESDMTEDEKFEIALSAFLSHLLKKEVKFEII